MANVYFLGRMDLEMLAINISLEIEDTGELYYNKNLTEGASIRDYEKEIAAEIAAGNTPVLIELSGDAPEGTIVVDHSGAQAGGKSALRQFYELLAADGHKIEWSRDLQLIEANDTGHIEALRAVGATQEEITRIRAADRAAQGITPEQESEGDRALRNMAILANLGHTIGIVVLGHSKTDVIMDRIATLDTPPREVVIFSPGETNFYGDEDRIARLIAAFPGGGEDSPRSLGLSPRGHWRIAQEISLPEFVQAYGD